MIELLYRDSDILICRKPAGVLSEASGDKPNMVSLLEAQTGEHIYPVNRLDRQVAGVLTFALNREACADLNRQIQAGLFHKEYQAVICGVPSEEKGLFFDYLFKDSRRGKVYPVKTKRKGVRDAQLEYEVKRVFYRGETQCSLVVVRPITGRTHQIRVQFASRGLPVWGDRKYGASQGKELALWASGIGFQHPKTGEEIEVRLPLKISGVI